MTDHVSAIRARRAESNQAIAQRDADRVVAVMLDDVSVSVAGGPVLTGRAANRAAFAEQFADRAFRGYVREADEIVVHDPPTEATERGRWTGRWQVGIRTETMRGSYLARWRRDALGWFIVSEVFVPG
ncbi:MAG: nuclear transport factor 2 family protein [Gemmatimonadetes bacterium]|nr:nuclear transport factor 2 family protein [Gemmatimonadota bacterium]MBK6845456.1 nuclear transport factor 2 family protein [Gemmatimonadota bacterium]MBK8060578.1 nuclear transport factor 2 family protein [Gemmatimonadota bacterium]MBK9409787.1 nuclear transport factor 2 family protein [Gemmatimonadota bacterium]